MVEMKNGLRAVLYRHRAALEAMAPGN